MRGDIGLPVPLADCRASIIGIRQEFLPSGAVHAEHPVKQRGHGRKICVFASFLGRKGRIRINRTVIPFKIDTAADKDFCQLTVRLQQCGQRFGQLTDIK